MLSRTRRMILGGIAVTGIGLTLPRKVLALSSGSAEALIDKVVIDINRVIASGKSEAAMIRDFKGIFDRYADNSYIAAFTLGRAAASEASATQKRYYSDAFSQYMARKYGKRFREFIGGKIDVSSVSKVKSWYEVDTVVRLSGEPPFNVTFRVWDRSGKDLFFNMIIEGVNLLIVEKEEIGALLDKRGGNLDRLIADLKNLG